MASLVEIYNAIREERVSFCNLAPQPIIDDIYVGNNAVVFRNMLDDGREVALKCYASRRRNAHAIYGERYLKHELCLHTLSGDGYVDVTVLPWIEGHTLESHLISRNVDYRKLSANFDRLALATLRHRCAHGDIKPDNIIVTPTGEMKYVDFDAAWLPGFTDADAEEIGTPAFSHPDRDYRHFDKHIDDFSLAMLSTTLAALAIKREAFEPYIQVDGSIFEPEHVIDGSDYLFIEAMRLFERRDPIHYCIARTLYKLKASTPDAIGVIEGLEKMFSRT